LKSFIIACIKNLDTRPFRKSLEKEFGKVGDAVNPKNRRRA